MIAEAVVFSAALSAFVAVIIRDEIRVAKERREQAEADEAIARRAQVERNTAETLELYVNRRNAAYLGCVSEAVAAWDAVIDEIQEEIQ